jgi:hypothetical protein
MISSSYSASSNGVKRLNSGNIPFRHSLIRSNCRERIGSMCSGRGEAPDAADRSEEGVISMNQIRAVSPWLERGHILFKDIIKSLAVTTTLFGSTLSLSKDL